MTQLDISALANVVESRGARRIAMQAPDGIAGRSSRVARALERELGVEVLLLGGSNHGPCHYRPPAFLHELEVPVLAIGTWSRVNGRDDDFVLTRNGAAPHSAMVPAEIDGIVVVEIGFVPSCAIEAGDIPPLVRALPATNDSIAIVTIASFLSWLQPLASMLRDAGIHAVIPRGSRRLSHAGQVFGCDYSVDDRSIGAYVFVGARRFHAEGLAWATRKPVVCFDPFTKRTDVIPLDDVQRRIDARGEAIRRSASARRFGVIVSPISGQTRLALARRILEWLAASARDGQLVILDEIRPEVLAAAPYDAYVNTACPRIVTEDAPSYDKPLLTPWELRVVLGRSGGLDYRFDQIRSAMPYTLCWQCV